MKTKDWELLEKLDEAFTRGEKSFGTVGRVTVGPKVRDDLVDLPAGQWEPTGKEDGLIGRIWEAEIYLDEALTGRQIILEPSSNSDDEASDF